MTKINLVSETFPWMVTVHALDPDVGVTCGELLDGLSDDLHKPTSAADCEAVPAAKEQIIDDSYRYNRSRASGVPGGRLGEGLRRMDCLGRDAVFGGVVHDERLVKRLVAIGEVLPATFVVRCVECWSICKPICKPSGVRMFCCFYHFSTFVCSLARVAICPLVSLVSFFSAG